MTDDYIIISTDNVEVYKNEIDIIVSQYIESLPDETMIYKAPVFKGLLLEIYNRKLKHIIQTDKQNRKSKYNNYSLLDDIFNNIYIPLVYRFCLVPTLLEFSCFVNIDNTNLTDIKNGVYRHDGAKVNPEFSQTVKKWYQICESALASKAFTENGIGAIFGLKSAHGWIESKQQIEIVNSAGTQATPEQIAEKYADVQKPRLIDAETS